jgi:hypothetical protein
MLSRIKLGYPEIRRALLDIDDQKLSVDDLLAISKQLPTSEEVRTNFTWSSSLCAHGSVDRTDQGL